LYRWNEIQLGVDGRMEFGMNELLGWVFIMDLKAEKNECKRLNENCEQIVYRSALVRNFLYGLLYSGQFLSLLVEYFANDHENLMCFFFFLIYYSRETDNHDLGLNRY
jgi:hypothetical protein